MRTGILIFILIAVIIILLIVNKIVLGMNYITQIKNSYKTVLATDTTDYDTSFKNNNSGNIRWYGSVYYTGEFGKDIGSFASFSDVRYGITAIGKQIITDYYKHGFDTLNEIINSYAPTAENDTTNYVNQLVKHLNDNGVSIDADSNIIGLTTNPKLLTLITQGIIIQESGITVPDTFINFCFQNFV